MDSQNPQHAHRIYFIEKSFKTKFILRFCALVAAGGLLTIGIIYILAMRSTTVSVVHSRVIVETTADYLLPILIQTVLIVMIFVSLGVMAVTLFVSHKLSGPLYRFKEVMDAFGDGEYLSDFNIRELDQLQDFAAAFNEMINKLGGHINELKDSGISLQEKLASIAEGDIAEQKRQSLKELKETAEKLNKAIANLKK